MGNQLCEATQQSSYKARILEICNPIDEQHPKSKLQPITFSDQGSPREKMYRDDEGRENSVDKFTSNKQDFSPMFRNQPRPAPFTIDQIKAQSDTIKNQKTSSYSSDYLSQSPTTKLAKFNLNQVYLKHMNSQHEEGNIGYKPMSVPFSVVRMVLSKRLAVLVEQQRPKFSKQYEKDDESFKLYKDGCYGHLLSDSSAIFLNSTYFYEGGFLLQQKGEFLPDGHGTYITQQGKYIGQFMQGRPHGKGKYVKFEDDDSNENHTMHVGEWQNGGLVKGTIENHLFKYEGGLKNRKPHGQGALIMKVTKAAYKGEFVDGKYHGEKAFYETSEYTYSGDFAHGKKHGHGVLSEKASALQTFNKKIRKQQRYEGTWREDRLEQRVLSSTHAS